MIIIVNLGVMLKTFPKRGTFVAKPCETVTPNPEIQWSPGKGEAAHGHNSSKVGLKTTVLPCHLRLMETQEEGALIEI